MSQDEFDKTDNNEIDVTETHPTVVSDPARRNQILIVSVVAIVAVVAMIAVAYFLFLRRPAKTETAQAAPAVSTGTVTFLMEQQWLVRMKLALAEEQQVARQITSTGRVVPAANNQALVAPPVAGILSGRNLPRVGQYVSRGQTVAIVQQVATSAEQAQVRAAATSVEVENARLDAERRAATSEVEAARVRRDLAQKEADRAQRLFDRKAFSERQLQAAQADLATAKASYDAAIEQRDALSSTSGISRGRAILNTANASYTVRAPLGGYVTKVNKSLGEQVSPGEAILEISNLDTVWVETPIFENDLNRLAGNVLATFTTAAYPGQEFKGTVLDVGAVIDEQTRAAKVIFQLPNVGRALRLGMQAHVRLDAGEFVTAMMIPKEAVLEHEGKKIVYVLLSGEEFERREVTVGDEIGNKIAVLTGLHKGERVVTQGAYQLKLQELSPAQQGTHSHET